MQQQQQTLAVKCGTCGAQSLVGITLPPPSKTYDLVFTWADDVMVSNQLYIAKVVDNSLTLKLKDGQFLSVTLGKTVPLPGEPGKTATFELRQLVPGESVWKLSPSIVAEDIHAFVTLIKVPNPASWLKG